MNPTNSSTPIKTEPKWWWKLLRLHYVIPAFLALLLLLSPFIYRSSYLSEVPEIDPPFDAVASGTVETAPEENAYSDYQLAASKLVDTNATGVKDLLKALEGTWADATPDVRLWLDDNHQALELWRIGTEKPDYGSKRLEDQRTETLLPLVQDWRTIARLAILKGNHLESERELEEAWKWHRALFRFSRHCGRNGSVFKRLVGSAIHRLAVDSIINWANNPRVTSHQLQEAIANVATDYELTSSLSTAFKSDYISIENMFGDSSAVISAMNISTMAPAEKVRAELHITFCVEPKLSKNLNRHYFQNIISQCDKPRYLRKTITLGQYTFFDNSSVSSPSDKTLTPVELHAAILHHAYFEEISQPYTNAFFVFDREQTLQNILVVALAVQHYKREQGHFPPDSAALIKAGYFTEMPLDALQSIKASIQYRNTKSCVTVYSLGEDGIDDGGCTAPLDDPRTGDYGFLFPH